MKKYLLATAALAMAVTLHGGAFAADRRRPGKALDMVLLPKFLGILPFDQAHTGALEAAKGTAESRAAPVPRPDA